MNGPKRLHYSDSNKLTASVNKISHLMTNHDWEDKSEPEKKAGGLIISKIELECRKCGLVAGLLPLEELDRDCDIVLVRSVMES